MFLAAVCSLTLAVPAALAPSVPTAPLVQQGKGAGGHDGGGGGGGGGRTPPPPDKVPPPGGTWGGPGDTVPPGIGDVPPPGVPPAPGATPGPQTPLGGTSGPAATPGGIGPSPRPTSPLATALIPPDTADVTAWTEWWRHNQWPYLDIHVRAQRGGTLTGSDDFFLGPEEGTGHGELAPARRVIEARIVPALLAALAEEHAHTLRVEASLALARIGSRNPEQRAAILTALARLLREPNQDVAETAAIALGVLGDERATETLLALVSDDDFGRELVGARSVPERIRSYAAYALGLLVRGTPSDVRMHVVSRLMDLCEHGEFANADVEVALYSAIGVLPIEERVSSATIVRAARDQELDRRVLSRRAQIAWLVSRLEHETGSGQTALVRAQIPIAIGRLARDTSATLRASLAQTLLTLLPPSAGEPHEMRASVALALGELGDCDAGGVDEEVRDALVRTASGSEPISRRFALVALGRIAGRAGDGEDPDGGLDRTRDHLVEVLEHGHSQLEPWAALALGVAAHERREAGAASDPLSLLALRQAAAESRRPQELGAYAIGLGLARDPEAAPLLLERLRAVEEIEARASMAVALGLIGDRAAAEPLRSLIDVAAAQPELLIGLAQGLGLLGDKRAVIDLLALIQSDHSQETQVAACEALSKIGDARAVDPLLALLGSEESTIARAAAADALGGVCDRRELPWETVYAYGSNYVNTAPTLTDGQRGVLDRE